MLLRGLMPAAIAALVLSLLVAPTVLAHAELVSANPGPDETVEGSPPELVTRFSQNLNPSRTRLEVRSAAGERVANGGEPGSTKREFVLTLPDLAPGDYEVRWTSFSSEDGELARGSYTFTVTARPTPSPTPLASPTAIPSSELSSAPSATPTPAPTASPAPTPTAVPADPSSDIGSVAIPIIAALLIVVVVAVWLLRGRRA